MTRFTTRSATSHRPLRERGAALLAAMLTVALVATYAATAMWQQWRAIEVESAERARIQSSWILIGALDWSRLILREDSFSRSDNTDNLTEPWSVPLEEARLSTFLAAQRNVSQVEDASAEMDNAFLSGRITDMQSRMNLFNLTGTPEQYEIALKQFTRLFTYLGLPQQELALIAKNMQQTKSLSTTSSQSAPIPLLPQNITQLTWWGVQQSTVSKLANYATILPLVPAKLNLNTASAEAIWASAEGLDMSDAQRIVQTRDAHYFKLVDEAAKLLSNQTLITGNLFDTSSSYFEIRGRMRIDQTIVEERSLVFKKRASVRTLWRVRGGFLRDSADTLGKS